MKKYLIPLLALAISFNACKKEELNDETPIVEINNGASSSNNNLYSGNSINASFGGVILDENDVPVSGATVSINGVSAVTNSIGVFTISGVSVDEDRVYVTVNKAGYFEGSRCLNPDANYVNNLQVKLIPKTVVASFDNLSGAVVNVPGGPEVVFESGDVANEDGTPYTGSVDVVASYLDPSSSDIFEIMPGDLQALNETGEAVCLETYGMIAVELFGSSGEPLNVASGQTVELTMPVSSGQLGSAPTTIPLWFFDDQDGNWVEEGAATLIGNEYVGEVSHFTFWNVDKPYDGKPFSCRILCNGTPSVNTGVQMVGPNGQIYGLSYTNGNGEIVGDMPSGLDVIVHVLDPCGNSIYSQQLQADNQPVAMGDVEACSSVSNFAVIEGTITDCNGNAVPNGVLEVNIGAESIFVFADQNGQVNSSVNYCSANSVTLIAYNLNGLTQSIPLPLPTTGNINFGVLPACNLIDEMITYSVDGGAPTIIHEVGGNDLMGGIHAGTNNSSIAGFNNDFLILSFTGATAGTYQATDVLDSTGSIVPAFNISSHTATSPNITINVISYSSAFGGYIEGSFDGTFSNNGVTRAIEGEFRVRRNQ